jgi:hypothetical protein
MSVNDVEKLMAENPGLLGFSLTDPTRRGAAEVKRSSKVQELMKRLDSASEG